MARMTLLKHGRKLAKVAVLLCIYCVTFSSVPVACPIEGNTWVRTPPWAGERYESDRHLQHLASDVLQFCPKFEGKLGEKKTENRVFTTFTISCSSILTQIFEKNGAFQV